MPGTRHVRRRRCGVRRCSRRCEARRLRARPPARGGRGGVAGLVLPRRAPRPFGLGALRVPLASRLLATPLPEGAAHPRIPVIEHAAWVVVPEPRVQLVERRDAVPVRTADELELATEE